MRLSQRANPTLEAIGVDPYGQHGQMNLGMTDLLVARRREIVELRDRYREITD